MSDDTNVINIDTARINRHGPRQVVPAAKRLDAEPSSTAPDTLLDGYGYRVGSHGYGYGPPGGPCSFGGSQPPPPMTRDELLKGFDGGKK